MSASQSKGHLILCIDTSLDRATVILSMGDVMLGHKANDRQMDHASWLHVSIRELLEDYNVDLNALDAVAVVEGPGSYTGLRVGMASAKGICFALGIPLITMSTLYLIAVAQQGLLAKYKNSLICPMIDARRMEVFAVIYDATLKPLTESMAIVLGEDSFQTFLEAGPIIFGGNGVEKWKKICHHPNAIFSDLSVQPGMIFTLAAKKFREMDFADLAYAEPAYIKNAYIAPGAQKHK